jgi:hypothetical protein
LLILWYDLSANIKKGGEENGSDETQREIYEPING